MAAQWTLLLKTISEAIKKTINTKRMAKSNYLWLFDNGHGGVIDGVYQTKGKRSPKWSDGSQVYEGEFNRAIVDRLVKLCNKNGIKCVNLVPELEDIKLSDRVKRANEVYESEKNCIFVSIHANAGGGSGYEVFTSKGTTKSDEIAKVFNNCMNTEFNDIKSRGVKEANFYVLKNTKMPAVLSENFFMDTYTPDFLMIYSEFGRDRIAKAHFNAIKYIEENKLI